MRVLVQYKRRRYKKYAEYGKDEVCLRY